MKQGARTDKLRLVGDRSADETVTADPLKNFDADLAWTILMARAQRGDGEAYLHLLQEITPYLRHRVSHYHRDARDIEDAVQDILLAIHAVRHTYDPERPFGPWLVGVAKRRVFDRLRVQMRRNAHEIPLAEEHEAIGAFVDSMAGGIERRRLEGAIQGLPPRQQQAIRLLKLREMSLKEASAESGMSIASLKVAVHRALKSLRGLLDDRS